MIDDLPISRGNPPRPARYLVYTRLPEMSVVIPITMKWTGDKWMSNAGEFSTDWRCPVFGWIGPIPDYYEEAPRVWEDL